MNISTSALASCRSLYEIPDILSVIISFLDTSTKCDLRVADKKLATIALKFFTALEASRFVAYVEEGYDQLPDNLKYNFLVAAASNYSFPQHRSRRVSLLHENYYYSRLAAHYSVKSVASGLIKSQVDKSQVDKSQTEKFMRQFFTQKLISNQVAPVRVPQNQLEKTNTESGYMCSKWGLQELWYLYCLDRNHLWRLLHEVSFTSNQNLQESGHPLTFLTDAEVEQLLTLNPMLVAYIPFDRCTKEIAHIAVKQCRYSYLFIPVDLQKEESILHYFQAVNQLGTREGVVAYLSEQKELLLEAIDYNPALFTYRHASVSKIFHDTAVFLFRCNKAIDLLSDEHDFSHQKNNLEVAKVVIAHYPGKYALFSEEVRAHHLIAQLYLESKASFLTKSLLHVPLVVQMKVNFQENLLNDRYPGLSISGLSENAFFNGPVGALAKRSGNEEKYLQELNRRADMGDCIIS